MIYQKSREPEMGNFIPSLTPGRERGDATNDNSLLPLGETLLIPLSESQAKRLRSTEGRRVDLINTLNEIGLEFAFISPIGVLIFLGNLKLEYSIKNDNTDSNGNRHFELTIRGIDNEILFIISYDPNSDEGDEYSISGINIPKSE